MTALLQPGNGQTCQCAFDNAKKSLQSDKLLVHYDPDIPVIIACRVFPYEVGAGICHKMKGRSERPIAFV